MRKPKESGTPIGTVRYRRWLSTFGAYRETVTQAIVEDWIEQFEDRHKDTAARVLDSLQFITFNTIGVAFRDALASLPGWSVSESKRVGKWRFVPFSQSSGESADSMMHRFRIANNLAGKPHNPMFLYRSELASEGLGPEDSVVFVDDFTATGDQVLEAWEIFAELLTECGNIYYVCVAASKSAIARVQNETDMKVIAQCILTSKDDIFDDACAYFDDKEKRTIEQYCKLASKANPRGRGNCGYVLVFAHQCPNNSIPILHAESRNWTPLFPRYEHH